MTPAQIEGFAYREAISQCRSYYEKGWPDKRCALIVTILDKVEMDALEIFKAAQPGKEISK